MITMTFQIAGSLLQPVMGMVTDRHPAPYSPVVGMMFTLSGLVSLAFAHSYAMILVSVVLIGIGSSIFHPEATRMARYAAGGRQGLAQGIFQVGGQAGGALGPVFAALIVVPWGQPSLAWFAVTALLAMMLLAWIGSKQRQLSADFTAKRASVKKDVSTVEHAPLTIGVGLVVLTLLMFTKNAYGESFRSFYTFYLIESVRSFDPLCADDAFHLPAGGRGGRADRRDLGRPHWALPDHLDLGVGTAALHSCPALR